MSHTTYIWTSILSAEFESASIPSILWVVILVRYESRYIHMGWLRLVGSIKLQVSFAKEHYQRDAILRKRPIILSILLTVATPYEWGWVMPYEYGQVPLKLSDHIFIFISMSIYLSLYLFIYVCIHIYIYTYIYINIWYAYYIYTYCIYYLHIYIYVYTHIQILICLLIYSCLSVYIDM